MSTNEQENQIRELIDSLLQKAFEYGNEEVNLENPERFEMVSKIERLKENRAHVQISFDQMLDYIDKIREPIKQADINLLLQTYLDMASRYYTQYEFSLLEEIEKQYKIEIESKRAIKKIEDLNDPVLMTVIEPLMGEGIAAAAEYKKLMENYPSLLQNAIDKLRDEWQRLDSIAVASRALTEDERLIQLLKAVADAAAHFIGVGAERIVIVPGRVFALYFFRYLENFAVLTVPIYSVAAPWEWSIFWHELAGYKVHRLEKDTTLEAIKEKLEELHKTYQASTELERQELLNMITWGKDVQIPEGHYRGNQISWDYLQALLTAEELDLGDLGSFEYQFERMLANLPAANKLEIYQQIKALKELGWSVDWFKELFEDAWGVLAIGDQLMPFFEDMLRRHAASDDRHPPHAVRTQVAEELLNLTNPYRDVEPSQTPEAIAAQQILKFISLLYAATRKFKGASGDQLKLQGLRDDLFGGVAEEIQQAIREWEERPDEAKRYAEDIIKSFDEFREKFKLGFEYDQKEKNQIKATIDEMLENQNYEQLLALSFYDADFGTGTTYQFTYKTAKYSITPTNLKAAINAGFIYAKEPSNVKKVKPDKITIKSQEDDGKTYNKNHWTTEANVTSMKAKTRKWIS